MTIMGIIATLSISIKMQKGKNERGQYTLFFFIRTSNFDAEAERSYIFWRFEAETFLKMFLNLPGIVFQPISADVTRQTIKEHFLLRYGIKLLAHTGLTCSDATCEMSRQPTLAKFGFKKRIDHRGLQVESQSCIQRAHR